MALNLRPANCERSRAWASMRLDGELSEFENALLTAHLRTCGACREYEESAQGAVLALRAQPLEQVGHPVAVPGRRRLVVRPVAVAGAAAAVAAVVGLTTVLSLESATRPATVRTPSTQAVFDVDSDVQQLRALRVIQLGGRPPRGSGVGQFGAVLERQP